MHRISYRSASRQCSGRKRRARVVAVLLIIISGGLAYTAPLPRNLGPAPSSVLVLDNCDPVFKGKDTYEDNLSLIDGSGRLAFRVSGFNNCESIGSSHMIATDPQRGWLWVLENVGHRVCKIDRAGKELLAIKDLQANALAVDPESGNVWVLTSKGTIHGEGTAVFDSQGKRLASYQVSGYDIAYDAKSKGFWIAGSNLIKISADKGTVSFNSKEITTWCSSSLAVHAATGRIWVTVRKHPQVPGSENELLAFDNDGTLKYQVALGDLMPFNVAVDQTRGTVWMTAFRRSVQRYSSEGKLEAEFLVEALTAQSEPVSGGAWVVTPTETALFSAVGLIQHAFPHKARTTQAWSSAW